VPSLSPNHVQLEFPRRAHLYTNECIQGRDVRHPTVIWVRDDAPLARSSGRELGQELLEGLFSRPISGLNGFIKDPMNILSGCFDQPGISPISTVSEGVRGA
jgi:hypothetical protein